jgi:6-pyruvoyltetrahydropterin/6-carboxytetrahydropterin synthase
MVDGIPTPVINISILPYILINSSISLGVAAVSKICIVQNSYLHFIFQDLGATFAKIFKKAMVYITRIEHFNAAHKLFNPNWSREKNEEVFGKCANENWHGHNFELHVTLKGEPSTETGFVYDVKKLSVILNEHVIEKLDHKNLNVDVDFMSGKLCSIENLIIGIWNQLVPHLPAGVQLHCLKLYETPRIYVEYYGN